MDWSNKFKKDWSKNVTRKYGRMIRKDWSDVITNTYSAVMTPVRTINKVLPLSYVYDQGQTGGCAAYSSCTMMSIYNKKKYNARWLYCQACKIDGDPQTSCTAANESELGTYIQAVFNILKNRGPKIAGQNNPSLNDGIKSYRWCTTVNEIKSAIGAGKPVILGINWYANFNTPWWDEDSKSWWIAWSKNWGQLQSGHYICCFGASDKYNAFRLVNTWGKSYPLVWIPYRSIARLMTKEEEGEAGVVDDR